MMIYQILIQILKLQINKNAVLAKLVHRWSNKRYTGRVHDIFHGQTVNMGSITHVFVHSGVYLTCNSMTCLMTPARMWSSISRAETVDSMPLIPQLGAAREGTAE